jgi:tetratricopeptide (TPR) repeat protein
MRFLSLGLLPAALLAASAFAAGDDPGSGAAAADPQYTEAVAAIKADQYAKAIPLLQAYVARAGNDANAENYLAYAHRKTGDLAAAFVHYRRALTIDPKHRGAHEYIGEAYLMAGDLPKAEEHLKVLDGLCTFSCGEYRDLKAAIAAYKAKPGAKSAAQ